MNSDRQGDPGGSGGGDALELPTLSTGNINPDPNHPKVQGYAGGQRGNNYSKAVVEEDSWSGNGNGNSPDSQGGGGGPGVIHRCIYHWYNIRLWWWRRCRWSNSGNSAARQGVLTAGTGTHGGGTGAKGSGPQPSYFVGDNVNGRVASGGGGGGGCGTNDPAPEHGNITKNDLHSGGHGGPGIVAVSYQIPGSAGTFSCNGWNYYIYTK